jgi:hypothetical protein
MRNTLTEREKITLFNLKIYNDISLTLYFILFTKMTILIL